MRTIGVVVLVGVFAMAALAQPPYVLWSWTYGGDQDDFGEDILAVDSTGSIIVGKASSFGSGFPDIYLIRIGEWGDTLWTRTYGGPGIDEGHSVIRTDDDGFVVCGHTTGGSYLFKTDLNGNVIWERVHAEYCGYSVIQTSDEGFTFTGATTSSSFTHVLLVKTHSDGTLDWTRTYGLGVGYAVRQVSDGGFLIAGTNNSPDVYIIRTDDGGDTLWTRTFDTWDGDGAYDLELTPDGGFVVAGTYPSFPYGIPEVLLFKMDAHGDSLWVRTYPDEYWVGFEYFGRSLVLTRDGGYAMAGAATFWDEIFQRYLYLSVAMKADSVGNQEWFEYYYDTRELNGVAEIDDGDYVLVGSTIAWPDTDTYDVSALRLNEYTGVREIGTLVPYLYRLHSPYPNPFNSVATIWYEVPVGESVQIRVYDVLGRNVGILHDGWAEQGEHRIVWDAGGVPSGVYFVRMEAGEFLQTRKVVLLK